MSLYAFFRKSLIFKRLRGARQNFPTPGFRLARRFPDLLYFDVFRGAGRIPAPRISANLGNLVALDEVADVAVRVPTAPDVSLATVDQDFLREFLNVIPAGRTRDGEPLAHFGAVVEGDGDLVCGDGCVHR